MKGRKSLPAFVVIVVAILGVGLGQAQGAGSQGAHPSPAGPFAEPQANMGTAFTYQGQLKKDSNPVYGECDFQFSLWDPGGSQVGTAQTHTAVAVTDGLFTIPDLDFGGDAFNGEARLLQIAVCCPAGSGSYTTLSPRQALTPSPYALALPGLWTQQNATSPNLIGGNSGNSVTAGAYGATIGGGGTSLYPNRVTDDYGTVGGGSSNQAGDNAGTTHDATYAAVGGGVDNTASGSYTTVGGGHNNTASGSSATVGGGNNNTASNAQTTVGGGVSNIASGLYATVPGGDDNTAQGNFSFAAGRQARADNQGCFVWGDSTAADIICSNNNRTIFRSTGGYYIYTNSGLTSGVYVSAGGSSWSSVSDRAQKENFRPVDTLALLEKLAAIEISTWNYTSQDPAIRHIGPMAQDFNALLPDLGGDGQEYINSLDADGVALAAIQGLAQVVEEQDAGIAALEARVSTLEQQNTDLEARLAALEARGNGGSSSAADFRWGMLGLALAGVAVGLVVARRGGRR